MFCDKWYSIDPWRRGERRATLGGREAGRRSRPKSDTRRQTGGAKRRPTDHGATAPPAPNGEGTHTPQRRGHTQPPGSGAVSGAKGGRSPKGGGGTGGAHPRCLLDARGGGAAPKKAAPQMCVGERWGRARLPDQGGNPRRRGREAGRRTSPRVSGQSKNGAARRP